MFEPSWKFSTSTRTVNGSGLLHKPLWSIVNQCLTFKVDFCGTMIEVLPNHGRIIGGGGTLWNGSRGRLIWGRRVNLIFDGRTPCKDYAYYFIGVENETRHGLKLFHDGNLELGL